MTRRLPAVFAALFIMAAANSQNAINTYTSGHYTLTCPADFTGIEAVADALNGLWNAFNGVFGFDPDVSRHPLKVTILADRAAFDAYIAERIGETRSQYIFLKYPKPENSELVLFPANAREGFDAFSGPALNRQAFLQYLSSFVQEPPLWIRDGFQAYFEKAVRDPSNQAFTPTGYSPWLETAKNLHADGARAVGSEGLLSAITGSRNSAEFYPQAWSFTAFLLSTEKGEYQRFLHEAFMILEGDSPYNAQTQETNTELVRNRFLRFNSCTQADADFAVWLEGQHTFNELVQSGVSAYNGGNYLSARKDLVAAAEVKPDDPIVSYYLGLVSYSEKNYSGAEVWYLKALASGADVSTVNWALGLNAFADKRWVDARKWLDAAKTSNPARYAEKADALVKSMPK